MARRAQLPALLAALLFLTAAAVAGLPETGESAKTGGPRRWRRLSIPVAFSNSLLKPNPSIRPESDVAGAVRRSLATWEAAAGVEFQVVWTDRATVSPAGNAGDGVSLVTIAQTPENLLVFAGDAAEISARTRVFFSRRGEISEADIVLNPYQQFSTDGSIGTFDLESTLTHELGHLLGLEHSVVPGSTMSELQGKNGTFNLASFGLRTLSEDDLAQVRAIYGPNAEEDCCGGLDARLAFAGGRPAKGLVVWLEESASGRVAAAVKTAADGAAALRGLLPGRYRLYAQDAAGASAGLELGEYEVAAGKTVAVSRRLAPQPKDFDVRFSGFNGQLSNLAVSINAGRNYVVYLGGRNLNPDELTIGTTSPYFTVSAAAAARDDYGRDLTVVSFEVRPAPETPLGEYTIFVRRPDGRTVFLPGNVTVEKFVNPYSTLTFDE